MDYSKSIKRWNDMNIGDTATLTKDVKDADVVSWCQLSSDMNPIHLDNEYASQTRFGKRVVPAIFVLGFISAALTKLIVGNVYASQNIKFVKPVFIGDTITAEVTVIEKLEDKHMLREKTVCTNQKNEIVMEGEALHYIWREVS